MLFIKVSEALSAEIRSGSPEEQLYTDNLALVSETLEHLKGRLEAWKGPLNWKESRARVTKTKMIINGENAGKVTEEGFFVIFKDRVQAVIPASASFAGVGLTGNVVVLDINWKGIASLNVWHVQISKQTQQKIVQAYK